MSFDERRWVPAFAGTTACLCLPPLAATSPSARSARCCSCRQRCCWRSSSSIRVATLIGTSLFTVDPENAAAGETFAGFGNYLRAFGDERFWHTTWNTVLYVVVTVPGALVVGLGLALLANRAFAIKWPVRLGLLLPWAMPLVFAGLIFRWFFEYNTGLVNNGLAALGIEPLQWLSSPTLAFCAICDRHRLEGVVVRGARAAGRTAGDSPLALRGGRGRRRVGMAAVRRDHAADARAGDLRRAHLSHDHRDPDLRHSVRDDRRRPGRCDRDARDVHPQDDARLPRLRLRLGARRADVRTIDGRDVGLSPLHAPQRTAATAR